MCGRFGLVTENGLSKYYNLPIDLLVQDDYNIAPSKKVPVVIMKDKIDLEFMQWGFIPHWAKDSKIGFKMINARAEEIETKPSYRLSLFNKRCLIPASFFYEWAKEGKSRQPYLFRLKDRDIFSFAGIYDDWKNEKGANIRTFTIITCAANSLVKQVHDRMPVILPKKFEEVWLNSEIKDLDTLKSMLKPYPSKEMVSYKVSKEVNSSKENKKTLIEKE